MNKKYKPVIAVAVLVILVAILGIVTHVVMKYIPSSEKMDLNEYYGEMADGEIALVIGTEKLEEKALISGEDVYLPLDVVFCQIHLFPAWYKLIDPVNSPSGKSDQNDQQTYHKDRYVFFYHVFFLSV